AVAVGDDHLVLVGERGQGPCGDPDVLDLGVGVRNLAALQEGVAAEGHHDAHEPCVPDAAPRRTPARPAGAAGTAHVRGEVTGAAGTAHVRGWARGFGPEGVPRCSHARLGTPCRARERAEVLTCTVGSPVRPEWRTCAVG